MSYLHLVLLVLVADGSMRIFKFMLGATAKKPLLFLLILGSCLIWGEIIITHFI